ncbi:MAG: hypothetical protein ASARMPRED_000927 [Alectoria sarmentosa]|nr:MAG: hypothetical protein ASARMPRED_000927 [Alectoria sarmentosa]
MTRSTDSWIQQLSTLMGDFYQLLAKMQYLDLDQGTIDYPPYTDPEKSINTILATQLGLTPEAIQLLQRLPYVAAPARWNHGAGDEEFILYGCFADFRKDGELEESRDPLYAGVDPKDESVGWEDEDGQYMRPWYVPLSRLGNHGVVLILNMKNRHLWVIDQEGGCSDPGLSDVDWNEDLVNKNSLDRYPSRPATEVLRDLMQKFISLEWIPGGIHHGYQHHHYKRLYFAHGWPDSFNGPAFNAARQVWEDEESAQYSAERPFQDVDRLELWTQIPTIASQLARCEADNVNPAWHAQFQGGSGSIPYESRKAELLARLPGEQQRRQELLRELEQARRDVEGVSGEVRRRREERLRLDLGR